MNNINYRQAYSLTRTVPQVLNYTYLLYLLPICKKYRYSLLHLFCFVNMTYNIKEIRILKALFLFFRIRIMIWILLRIQEDQKRKLWNSLALLLSDKNNFIL